MEPYNQTNIGKFLHLLLTISLLKSFAKSVNTDDGDTLFQDLADDLLSMFTAKKMAKAFFTNSGSEANDSQV